MNVSERTEVAIEILRYARDAILTDKSKWCQDHTAVNRYGVGAQWDSGAAVAWCADGALLRAALELGLVSQHAGLCKATAVLSNACSSREGYVEFNDADGREYPEIIDLFDAAIKDLDAA